MFSLTSIKISSNGGSFLARRRLHLCLSMRVTSKVHPRYKFICEYASILIELKSSLVLKVIRSSILIKKIQFFLVFSLYRMNLNFIIDNAAHFSFICFHFVISELIVKFYAILPCCGTRSLSEAQPLTEVFLGFY